MRTYKEENSNSMFSTEILHENTAGAFDHIRTTESKAE